MAGGVVTPRASIDGILALAAEHRLPVHLDGARLWNAPAATGLPERELARGLLVGDGLLLQGPSARRRGSCVLGTVDSSREARRTRKLFGGAMRQVGILAAAARVALADERHRLVDDHASARRLAEGLGVDPREVETTSCSSTRRTRGAPRPALRERGVLALPASPTAIRFVTHADVGRERRGQGDRRLSRGRRGGVMAVGGGLHRLHEPHGGRTTHRSGGHAPWTGCAPWPDHAPTRGSARRPDHAPWTGHAPKQGSAPRPEHAPNPGPRTEGGGSPGETGLRSDSGWNCAEAGAPHRFGLVCPRQRFDRVRLGGE